jgi:hypothetical protein
MKPVVVNLSKKQKNLYKLHHISQKWITELEFIHDEQHFLQDLISTFFVDLCSVELFPDTRKLNQKLEESIKKGNMFILEIQTHDKHLITLLESTHLNGEADFRKAQRKLANRVEQFVQSNKLLKSRVFAIIKNIMKQHKQKRLIPHANSPKVDTPME